MNLGPPTPKNPKFSQAVHIHVSRRVLVLRRRGGSSSVSSLAWRSCTTPLRPLA